MESSRRIRPNKLNELYILPIFFIAANITVVLWFYLVYEYSQSNETFAALYRFDQASIDLYLGGVKNHIILLTLILLVTPVIFKYKKRWLLIAITFLHLGELYYFFFMG